MSGVERSRALEVQSGDPVIAESARADIIAGHPEWTSEAKNAVMRGEVITGMTRLQVCAAWGADNSLRQIAGGFMSDRTPRERWLYDRAPLLVMAYFADGVLVKARAYDSIGTPVAIEMGEFGLRLPSRSAVPASLGDNRLLLLAQRVDPDW